MTYKKGLILFVTVLLLVFGGYAIHLVNIANPQVIEELRSDPRGVRASRVMLLRFPDGRDLPVNYLREGDTVFAGADFSWWKALRDNNVPVTVLIKGEELQGVARVVMDNPSYRDEVFSRLRPTVPRWLPEWATAKLVVIDLNSN